MDWAYLLVWEVSAFSWAMVGYVNAFASGKESWTWPKFIRTMTIGTVIGTYAGVTGQMVSQDIFETLATFLAQTGGIAVIDKVIAFFGKLLPKKRTA